MKPQSIEITDKLVTKIKFKKNAEIMKLYSKFDLELMQYCVYTGSSLTNDILAEMNFVPDARDYFIIDDNAMKPLCKFLLDNIDPMDGYASFRNDCAISFMRDGKCYQIYNTSYLMKMLNFCSEQECIAALLSLFDTNYTKCGMYKGKIYGIYEFLVTMMDCAQQYAPVNNAERLKTMIDRGFKICDRVSSPDKNVEKFAEQFLVVTKNFEQTVANFSTSGPDIIYQLFDENGDMYCHKCKHVKQSSNKHLCYECSK